MADDRLARLVDAVLTISGDVGLEQILQRIVEAARDLVGARYAALGVIDHASANGEGSGVLLLSAFLHSGMDDDAVVRIGHLPQGHGILGLLIEHPETLRLSDLTKHPASVGFPAGHPPMGTFLGAPVRVHGQVFGNLYLTEKADEQEFTADDQEMVEALAAVAGSAIANAQLFSEVRRLTLIADRERIGRDLHDTVIQRLFATGLSLQALGRRLDGSGDANAIERITEAVDDLDDTIREIRGVIFSLQGSDSATGLRARAAAICSEIAPAIGSTPRLRFDGPVDLVTSFATADQVMHVLREALTNVARHAQATKVDVTVVADGSQLTMTVGDDGVGLPAERRSGAMGLANLEKRAIDLGGEFIATSTEHGTTLRWSVPL